jgi:predicted metal-dependent phosphoesterase TrpH
MWVYCYRVLDSCVPDVKQHLDRICYAVGEYKTYQNHQDRRLTMKNNGKDSTWSKVDLHVHTNASDGIDGPWEVVRLAAQRGIRIISVVDYDMTAGLDDAMLAGACFGVEVIPGIELSAEEDGRDVHLLGYFIDHENDELQRELARQRAARVFPTKTTVEILKQLGFPISWLRLGQISGHLGIGRPHIARALIEASYVASYDEAKDKLIGRGKLTYAPRPDKLAPLEAIELLQNAGGLPVLAHPLVESPSGSRWSFPQMERLEDYQRAGLVGLEAYYTGYPLGLSYSLESIAGRYGLIATGGSDYHGKAKPDNRLGGVYVPLSSARALQTIAQIRQPDVSSTSVQMEVMEDCATSAINRILKAH